MGMTAPIGASWIEGSIYAPVGASRVEGSIYAPVGNMRLYLLAIRDVGVLVEKMQLFTITEQTPFRTFTYPACLLEGSIHAPVGWSMRQ